MRSENIPSWKITFGRTLALLLLGWILIGALWTAAEETRPRPPGSGRAASPAVWATPGPATATPIPPSPTPLPPSPTSPPAAPPTPTSGAQAVTPLPSPTRTPCRPPADWIPYRVQPGDTAFRLATLAGISLPRFLEANCLRGPALFIGQRVYLPVRLPTPTPNLTPCGPPSDWVLYTVQPGETLYRLAVRFQVPLYLLMQANCLTSPALTAGQRLYVPPMGTPTATPLPPPPPPPPPSPPPSPTATPTLTPAPSATPTETPLPTETPSPSPSPAATETPTETPAPTSSSLSLILSAGQKATERGTWASF